MPSFPLRISFLPTKADGVGTGLSEESVILASILSVNKWLGFHVPISVGKKIAPQGCRIDVPVVFVSLATA